ECCRDANANCSAATGRPPAQHHREHRRKILYSIWSNAYADSNSNSDRYSYSYSYCYRYCNAYRYSYGDILADGYTYCHAQSDAHAEICAIAQGPAHSGAATLEPKSERSVSGYPTYTPNFSACRLVSYSQHNFSAGVTRLYLLTRLGSVRRG